MPTPDEPIAEQLRAKVVARLGALTAGATYWYTPGEVAADWKHHSDCQDLAASKPFYGVVDATARRPRGTFTRVFAKLEIVIVVWVMDDDNRRRALRRAIKDVVTAVYTDETWDGLAMATDVRGIATDEAAVAARPLAYGEILLEIEYDVARTAA